jgi:hypothetical protein
MFVSFNRERKQNAASNYDRCAYQRRQYMFARKQEGDEDE